MQISAANLLATQTQAQLRPRGTTPAFEPMFFAKAAPAAVPDKAVAAPDKTAASALSASPAASGGFVRPGTNLDIKI